MIFKGLEFMKVYLRYSILLSPKAVDHSFCSRFTSNRGEQKVSLMNIIGEVSGQINISAGEADKNHGEVTW